MRKLISYILVLFMTWQIIGFVGYFEFSYYLLKKDIKKLLKEGVPEDELVYFEFSKKEMNNLIWIKKNEFKLNGNMYDVVRTKPTKDKFILECVSDTQETILFAKLDQTISKNLGNKKGGGPVSKWLKLLHTPVIVSGYDLSVSILPVEDLFKKNFKTNFPLVNADIPVPHQPPSL